MQQTSCIIPTHISTLYITITCRNAYDAWGKVYSVTGSMADTLGQINPIRYRSYYYDNETGFYYLNSRYYDPEIKRFINADEYITTAQGIFATNMFAYCLNNPVNLKDNNGTFAEAIALLLSNPVGWFILVTAAVAIIALALIYVVPWESVGQSITSGWEWIKSKVSDAANSISISFSISNTVSKAKSKIRKEQNRYDYWIASYVDFGGGNGTYTPTIPLSYSRAISYVRAGGDVFADSKQNAKRLAVAVGNGITDRDPAHGELGYWRHYHARRGMRRIGGHIFYV